MAEIKKQAFCDGYKIYVDMEGSVHVEYDGQEVKRGKTKNVLTEISYKVEGFYWESKWTTRQLGNKLIDFLNDESLVITYKTEFQLNENDFVKKSEETDKQNEKKSQEKKYYYIFIEYIRGEVGTFNKDEMLESQGCKDIDELWEEVGSSIVCECEDSQYFIHTVKSIEVIEFKTKPEESYLDEVCGDRYDEGFEVDCFEVPQEGYVVESYNQCMLGFNIEVNASDEFDIEELCVHNGIEMIEITYKGEKCSYVRDNWSDSMGARLSYDGEVLYDDTYGLDDDYDWD